MTDYISREAAKAALRGMCEDYKCKNPHIDEVIGELDKVPEGDAIPVSWILGMMARHPGNKAYAWDALIGEWRRENGG